MNKEEYIYKKKDKKNMLRNKDNNKYCKSKSWLWKKNNMKNNKD